MNSWIGWWVRGVECGGIDMRLALRIAGAMRVSQKEEVREEGCGSSCARRVCGRGVYEPEW